MVAAHTAELAPTVHVILAVVVKQVLRLLNVTCHYFKDAMLSLNKQRYTNITRARSRGTEKIFKRNFFYFIDFINTKYAYCATYAYGSKDDSRTLP